MKRLFVWVIVCLCVVIVLIGILLWPAIRLAFRQIHVSVLLRDGENVLRIYVPAGRYVVQVREHLPGSAPRTTFEVRGSVTSGAGQMAVLDKYIPCTDRSGVVIFLDVPEGHVEISIQYTRLSEGPPVFLFFGPAK